MEAIKQNNIAMPIIFSRLDRVAGFMDFGNKVFPTDIFSELLEFLSDLFKNDELAARYVNFEIRLNTAIDSGGLSMEELVDMYKELNQFVEDAQIDDMSPMNRYYILAIRNDMYENIQ